MATIRICDLCQAKDTEKKVRAYRWSALIDKENYKVDQLVKVDLCKECADEVLVKIAKILL